MGKDEQTLGAVLSISFWRFLALPALSTTFVYLIKHHTAYLQDPILVRSLQLPPPSHEETNRSLFFSQGLVLTLSTLTPALLPLSASLTSYQTLTYLKIYWILPFLTAFPLAASVAVAGQGVTFESRVDWGKTLKSALGGGVAGALAMIVQVLSLMPLRTVMNYRLPFFLFFFFFSPLRLFLDRNSFGFRFGFVGVLFICLEYRFGGSTRGAWNTLLGDGGYRRLYAGLPAALFQGPLSRFGDTAVRLFV